MIRSLIAAAGIRNTDYPMVVWDLNPQRQTATGRFSCHGDQKVVVSRADKDLIAKISPNGPFERVQLMAAESEYSLFVIQLSAFVLSVLGPAQVVRDPKSRTSSPLEEPTPTVFDLINLRFLEAESVRNFVDDYGAGLFLSDLPFSGVFGTESTMVEQALQLPPEGRRERALREIAAMREPMRIRFLEEWLASKAEVPHFERQGPAVAGFAGLLAGR